MPNTLVIIIAVAVVALVVISVYLLQLFVIRKFAATFSLSSMNQYIFLGLIVVSIFRALIVLVVVQPNKSAALALVLTTTLWASMFLLLLFSDRRKLYRAEVYGITACGLWYIVQLLGRISQSGLDGIMLVEIGATGLSFGLLGIILSHPFDVLRRANRLRKLK